MKSLNRAAVAVLLIAIALLLPAGALLWLRLASPSDGARGEAIFGPAVAQRLMNFFRDLGGASRPAAPPLAFPELTDREREILNPQPRLQHLQQTAGRRPGAGHRPRARGGPGRGALSYRPGADRPRSYPPVWAASAYTRI